MTAVLALFSNPLDRWIDPGLVTAFILGAGVTASIAMVWSLLEMDGSRSYREGREAETWTKGVLRRRRNDGWSVFHDLEFEGRNIDHVLIGPKGAISVETKRMNGEATLTPTSIQGSDGKPLPWSDKWASQAAWQARTLRLLLFAGGVRTEVFPVVILWGRGVRGVPMASVNGVPVGQGDRIDEWFDMIQSARLSDAEVRTALGTVEGFKAGRGAHRSKALAPVLNGEPTPAASAENLTTGTKSDLPQVSEGGR